MYALERGLKMKWLAILFCLFTAVAALGIGNMVQSNSIALLVNDTWGVPSHISGIAIATLVALVIIFGVKGIAKVCTTLVPLMAMFYIVGCLWLLILNFDYVPAAISLIIDSAFSTEAVG